MEFSYVQHFCHNEPETKLNGRRERLYLGSGATLQVAESFTKEQSSFTNVMIIKSNIIAWECSTHPRENIT
jgi:hypothetical protein